MQAKDILELISQKLTLNMNTKISELKPNAGLYANYTIEHFLVDYKVDLLHTYGKITDAAVINLKELYYDRTLLERELVVLYLQTPDKDTLEEIKTKEFLIKKIEEKLNKYGLLKLNISLEQVFKNDIKNGYNGKEIENGNTFVKTCKESKNN